jgi:hypothetical protein
MFPHFGPELVEVLLAWLRRDTECEQSYAELTPSSPTSTWNEKAASPQQPRMHKNHDAASASMTDVIVHADQKTLLVVNTRFRSVTNRDLFGADSLLAE